MISISDEVDELLKIKDIPNVISRVKKFFDDLIENLPSEIKTHNSPEEVAALEDANKELDSLLNYFMQDHEDCLRAHILQTKLLQGSITLAKILGQKETMGTIVNRFLQIQNNYYSRLGIYIIKY